ncbi:hypothetical protein GCM10025867_08940 [Frondihabitans sucicola]|uniref:Uncharacterized protein n=1 Tax=Frondihabitans sucicola TaxID=1268041 RepID=A0ABM8GJS2_9MICO|nr:hypothetical protein [Frondihabitans sucicola]BDZ48653.1 hypothetical protein GCM10025867_08940 [Frondihabitans sucicola]
MEMRNCTKWTTGGLTFEVCDFGSFLVLHLPTTTTHVSRQIRFTDNDWWDVTDAQGTLTLTLASAKDDPICLPAPPLVAGALQRWFRRVAPHAL